MLLSDSIAYSQTQNLRSQFESFNNKAEEEFDKGDYERAIEFYQKALSVIIRIYENDTSKQRVLFHYSNTLFHIGYCYYIIGDYQQALEYFKEALSIGEKTFVREEHPGIASILNNIGICYNVIGNYQQALTYHKEALSNREKALSKEHPDYAASLNNIGNCYAHIGDYQQALEYYKEALSIKEMTLGQVHQDCAVSLNNIGLCYDNIGDYQQALGYYKKALSINEKTLGKHSAYALNLNNIGSCYCDIGDYQQALEYYKEALSIIENTLGREHPDYALILNNICACYLDIGENYQQVREYHKEVLSNRERSLGKNHPGYASSLNDIGAYYYYIRDYKQAIEYCKEALLIKEKIMGKEHPEYAAILNNIGNCYYKIGDYWQAIEYLKEALIIKEGTLGKTHPHYTDCLFWVGYNSLKLGDNEMGEDSLSKYYELSMSNVQYSFPSLTEVQREHYWKRYDWFFANRVYFISTYMRSPIMLKTSFDCALFSKGLLLNTEIEMRKLILESGDDEALRIYEEMRGSRAYLDRLYESPEGKMHEIDSLNNLLEMQHRELTKRSKAFGDYSRNLAIKWEDVRSALGKKDLAIEFATYTQSDTTHYIALTLKSEYTEPHLVELFNDKELDKSNPRNQSWYANATSTNLIWGNLADELKGVDNVYFSPVGELNYICIEYLPAEGGKHLLFEKRNYYRLSSTRELVKSHQIKKASDAVVYGGINYDVTPKSKLTGKETETELLAKAASRQYMLDSLPRNRGEKWDYLPGTKIEAESIATILNKNKVKNELFEGEVATEESFNALSGAKKDIIHIATHGFYYTELEAIKKEDLAFMINDNNRAPKEDKMMTRSGLLFAGARNTFDGNEIPRDVEDGIVTAKDISRMDLRGTDLVVLSACRSGLGDIKGDGVYGLQRGFKKAGVQTIVMSLWEVDDDATLLFMETFYRGLSAGKSKRQSFSNAVNTVRNFKGKRIIRGKSELVDYSSPKYWASFIMLD